MGVWPAYLALVVEAQVDAAVRAGMPPRQAAELVAATIEGSAALLAHRDYDTLAVRREVTSPGGGTARGLERSRTAGCGRRSREATDAVLEPVTAICSPARRATTSPTTSRRCSTSTS